MPNAEYLCLQNDTFPRLPCDACHHVCLICSFHWRLVIRKTVLTRLENLLKLRGKFQRNHSDAQYLIQLMLYSDFLFQKQELSHGLSDEVFVISRIIKVEVSVISLSLRLRLITLTSTLIIPDITKTESNNCFIILYLQVISQFLAGSMKRIEKPFLLRCPRTWH